MRIRLRSKITLLFMMCALLLAIPAVAFADNIESDIIESTSVNADYIAGDEPGVSVKYLVKKSGNACDANDGTGVSFGFQAKNNGVDASSDIMARLSTDDSSAKKSLADFRLDLLGCTTPSSDNSKTVVFTTKDDQVAPGKYTITVKDDTIVDPTAPESYDSNSAVWHLNVLADGGVVTPSNNAPTVVDSGAADAFGKEGQTLQTSGGFSDSGDTLTLSVPSGTPGTFTPNNANGTWTWSLPTNDDVDQASITVTATDSQGATATDTFDYRADNVAPTVQLSGPATVNENKAGSESYDISVTDPGTADTHQLTNADCGENGVLQGTPTLSGFSCRFPDGAANVQSIVSATVQDDDQASGSGTKTVSINNVAPTLSNLGVTGGNAVACLAGNNVEISYDVSDPGVDDFTGLKHNWGDGTTNASYTHTYSAGTYTISVKGADSDGDASNELQSKAGDVALLYNMSAIQPPFNPDGTSTFKYGFTIPVKVKITDCNNQPVSGLAPKLGLSIYNPSTPGTVINEADFTSTSAADSGTTLRYSSDGQYIYNLSTKSSQYITDQNATYWVTVKVLDSNSNPLTNPAQISAKFGLKTK
jgi:hypothetical protein